jgi:hypothetical protein
MNPALDQRIKAIVLTYDRHRAITEHMLLQYERLWPDHPFLFRIPFQKLRGNESATITYIEAPGGRPADIPATVLRLLADLDEEEWVYWCMDDKYPIRLVTERIARLVCHAIHSPKMSGLLFCRCRQLLKRPERTLYRGKWRNSQGDVYFERRGWFQIFIHQLLRVKVLRHLFSHFPPNLPSAQAMDKVKHQIVKLPEHRLFVTKNNFAVFGESTSHGSITQNCYDSIVTTDISLPEWFGRPNGRYVTLGEL